MKNKREDSKVDIWGQIVVLGNQKYNIKKIEWWIPNFKQVDVISSLTY